ncbi:MAG: DUF4365 domain-containing protein [Planctomycetaceae bacterium]
MSNPKHTEQQRQGGIGAVAFDLFVKRELGWVFRPVHQEHDFGIDGFVDIVADGELTGTSLAIQTKCGTSYIAKRSAGGIRYDGQIKHLNYYANMNHPVILVVLDEHGENGVWCEFTLERTMPGGTEDRWWIEIPETNRLDRNVRDQWLAIAGPTWDITAEVRREWETDRAISWATHLIYSIDKDDVLTCNTAPLLDWQAKLSKTKEMTLSKRAKCEFWFDGWDDDPRELFEIPEVREYYKKTMEHQFPWIYWLEPDNHWTGYMLLLACLCPISTKVPVHGTNYIETDGVEPVMEWMNQNFQNLNVFTDQHDIDIEINKELSFNLQRFMETKLFPPIGSGG